MTHVFVWTVGDVIGLATVGIALVVYAYLFLAGKM